MNRQYIPDSSGWIVPRGFRFDFYCGYIRIAPLRRGVQFWRYRKAIDRSRRKQLENHITIKLPIPNCYQAGK